MSKIALAIPVAIGVVTAVFLSVYFGPSDNALLLPFDNSKNSDDSSRADFTLAGLVERGSPYLGESDAQITIVEFGDYQCTFCYKFHKDSLETIHKEYIESGKANLVFVDFPLNGPDSVLAAEAAHCAKEQGKFWEMHDTLYNNWNGERTGWVTRDSIDRFAQSAGIDTTPLNECLDSKKYQQTVLDTYEYAQGIDIDATPSFLIISGDKIVKITGNQPLEVFRKTLDGL
jgi:protein-disulfide isomerase